MLEKSITNKDYFLDTGKNDDLRLKILNRMYNPVTIDFLGSIGLTKGMSILEYGCGTGSLAIALAKIVGETGKVTAIDSSPDSLQIAQDAAKMSNIDNIEFKLCNVDNISKLNIQFDLAYGRWVLLYTQNLSKSLESIIDSLKPGGILVCEELDFLNDGHFSYPVEPMIDKYHEFTLANCLKTGLDPSMASRLYHEFQLHLLKNINVKANQPLRTTPEEKSTYRLGLSSMSNAIIQNNLCTKDELINIIHQLSNIEKNNTIIGGFRSLLVSGIKTH